MSSYQAGLPHALYRKGMLRRVLSFAGDFDVFDPDENGELRRVKQFRRVRWATRLAWAGWRRLPGTGNTTGPQVVAAWLADRTMSRWVPASAMFHGITTLSLAGLQAARRQGATTLVESTVHHPFHWQAELGEECRRFGVSRRRCAAMLTKPLTDRILREYELADAIVVRSSFAKKRFQDFPCGNRAVVVLAGVDHEQFTPAAAPPEKFNVVFAGRLELGKGVPYLLQAWERLSIRGGELVLAGEVRPEMEEELRRYRSPSIKVLGHLCVPELARVLRDSSVLVLPSVNESLGRVIMEAMAAGLPVIASDMSGAEDCVEPGRSGFVVKARDADALADAIQWCERNRDQAREMGKAGREIVLRRLTLAHYEERQIALYKALARGLRPGTNDESIGSEIASVGSDARSGVPAGIP